MKLLVINTGSTSTKLSLFEDENEIAESTLCHSAEELGVFTCITEQSEMRLACVQEFLRNSNTDCNTLDAVVGRGGLLKPISSGTYRVNEAMLADLRSARYGEHASNLAAIIAHGIADKVKCPAFVVDPVVVDEMEDIARFSGLPEVQRRSIFHALNQKSAARETAAQFGKPYEECNFIVAHLGGGISVAAHKRGRVIDVNNALDGEGPFSPERAGGIPIGPLAAIAFSGKYSESELKRKLVGGGGVVAYLGTNDMLAVEEAYHRGDQTSVAVVEAMAYQISKEIAMHGATLKGQVDSIILTGGLARSDTVISLIRERVSFLAPVTVVPGEREMLSLARGALAVLKGLSIEKEYHAA